MNKLLAVVVGLISFSGMAQAFTCQGSVKVASKTSSRNEVVGFRVKSISNERVDIEFPKQGPVSLERDVTGNEGQLGAKTYVGQVDSYGSSIKLSVPGRFLTEMNVMGQSRLSYSFTSVGSNFEPNSSSWGWVNCRK